MAKFKLRSGNSVKVVSGKFRETIDIIKKIDRNNEVVYLESVSRIKFVKNSKSEEKNKNKTKKILIPIHISNVTLWEEKK
jgi:ribosomal protein L24